MPDDISPDRVRAIAAMIRFLKGWRIERISETPMKAIYAALLGMAMTVPVHAAERTVKTESLACNPERQFHLSERIRASGDTKALKAFTAGALLAGTCVALKPGASVLLTPPVQLSKGERARSGHFSPRSRHLSERVVSGEPSAVIAARRK